MPIIIYICTLETLPMMNHQPYSLQTPHMPANLARWDMCDMCCPMYPLTGICASRGNAPGYRYVSPDGDGFPVTYSVTHSHTDHSSLFTAHSSLNPYTYCANNLVKLMDTTATFRPPISSRNSSSQDPCRS